VTALTYSGLGTGISANAFARHGIATTIVEIDPAVYDAARQYFGLSDPGNNNVFLQDARGWVRSRRAMVEAEDPSSIKYDVVVHDCFSGGGVPEHLFSIEFWNDLKTIMSPEGVIAVVSSLRHYICSYHLSYVVRTELCWENCIQLISSDTGHFAASLWAMQSLP
jgi:spermidine synthase